MARVEKFGFKVGRLKQVFKNARAKLVAKRKAVEAFLLSETPGEKDPSRDDTFCGRDDHLGGEGNKRTADRSNRAGKKGKKGGGRAKIQWGKILCHEEVAGVAKLHTFKKERAVG